MTVSIDVEAVPPPPTGGGPVVDADPIDPSEPPDDPTTPDEPADEEADLVDTISVDPPSVDSRPGGGIKKVRPSNAGVIDDYLVEIYLDQVPNSYWNIVRSVRHSAHSGALRPVLTCVFGGSVQIGNAFSDVFEEFAASSHDDDRAGRMNDLLFYEGLVVGTSFAVSSTATAGYAVWMLRGGTLLTTFMSPMPAWQAFDPLPILADRDRDDEEDDDETLASLISNQ